MSNVCVICSKRYNIATKRVKTRSHFNPTSTHKQSPNLQWLRLPNGKRVRACTQCIKTLAKKAV